MLLRTVSSRPDLALAIRNVAFLRGSYDDPQGKEGEMPITLLQLLPRIRQLEFFEPFELAFLMTNYPIGLNLDNLDTLSAGWQLQDMANVARVWALPAIRTLRIRTKAFHNIDHRIHTLSTWPASCTLRCLEIDKTLLEEASIARMLECSPSLEVLHLRHWFNVAGKSHPSLHLFFAADHAFARATLLQLQFIGAWSASHLLFAAETSAWYCTLLKSGGRARLLGHSPGPGLPAVISWLSSLT